MSKNTIEPGLALSLISKLIAEATPVTAFLASGTASVKLRGVLITPETSGLEIEGNGCKLRIPLKGEPPGAECEFSFDERDRLFEETRRMGDTASSIRFSADSFLVLVFTY